MVIAPSPSRFSPAWANQSPVEVAPALSSYRIVDVREPYEFNDELGHLPGAELVPLATLGRAMSGWDRSGPVLVVCRSGRRAEAACAHLAAAGFGSVTNLRGGMIAWRAARVGG